MDTSADDEVGYRKDEEREDDAEGGAAVQSTGPVCIPPPSQEEAHDREPEIAPGHESDPAGFGQDVEVRVVRVPPAPKIMVIPEIPVMPGSAILRVRHVIVGAEPDPGDGMIDDHSRGLSPDVPTDGDALVPI